jgi:hypothetical protein
VSHYNASLFNVSLRSLKAKGRIRRQFLGPNHWQSPESNRHPTNCSRCWFCCLPPDRESVLLVCKESVHKHVCVANVKPNVLVARLKCRIITQRAGVQIFRDSPMDTGTTKTTVHCVIATAPPQARSRPTQFHALGGPRRLYREIVILSKRGISSVF